MSELQTLLTDTTSRVLADIATMEPTQGWRRICDAGLNGVLRSEEKGGFGGHWDDALIVIRACGYHASANPLPEAILAGALADEAGTDLPDGMVTIAPHTDGNCAGGRFTGTMAGVPWGRDATHIAGLTDEGTFILVARSDAGIEEHHNVAGEPRDTLRFENAAATTARLQAPDIQAHGIQAWGAMLRSAQIAGALAGALELSVAYTSERQQFGRPLAKVQAIQQQLAVLAEETAAAGMAAAAAFRAAGAGRTAFAAGAAKLRANRAARLATGIAHQVHGAMGFTAEYRLHPLTRRLWAWQTEFGNERLWGERIGAQICARGGEHFWSDLVGQSE
jgi:acyl-CoA dehydrogenase